MRHDETNPPKSQCRLSADWVAWPCVSINIFVTVVCGRHHNHWELGLPQCLSFRMTWPEFLARPVTSCDLAIPISTHTHAHTRTHTHAQAHTHTHQGAVMLAIDVIQR